MRAFPATAASAEGPVSPLCMWYIYVYRGRAGGSKSFHIFHPSPHQHTWCRRGRSWTEPLPPLADRTPARWPAPFVLGDTCGNGLIRQGKAAYHTYDEADGYGTCLHPQVLERQGRAVEELGDIDASARVFGEGRRELQGLDFYHLFGQWVGGWMERGSAGGSRCHRSRRCGGFFNDSPRGTRTTRSSAARSPARAQRRRLGRRRRAGGRPPPAAGRSSLQNR